MWAAGLDGTNTALPGPRSRPWSCLVLPRDRRLPHGGCGRVPLKRAPVRTAALAVGEGAVWVVDRADGTLARVDPDKNSVSWSGGVGRDPTAVTVGAGSVWVAGGEEGNVARIDPDGPRVVERRATGSSPSALTVAEGSVWA